MRKAILDIPKQFAWKPEVVNKEKLGKLAKFIVAGMGGSNLAAWLIKARDQQIDILTHKEYGLPPLSAKELKSRLFVACSYSGDTEETIDALSQALKKSVPLAVVSTGGQIIELAEEKRVPYIQLPDTGIQPRAALGFQLVALLRLMGSKELLEEASELAKTLRPGDQEKEGQMIAEKLRGSVPIIYSSWQNLGLAYAWKIKFNETGKVPAFYNIFPELNHNEMTGFADRKKLNDNFHFIFLKDESDHPKVQKRMDVTKKLYEQRGLPVEVLELAGPRSFHKIFVSLVLADWAAFYTAQLYGLEPEQVPMVEEMKSLLRPR